jgi:ferredoxin-nitrite reductase
MTDEGPATRAAREPRRGLRPAPDWDLVLKRNSIERMKREKLPADIRGDLPTLIATGYEAIPEEDIVRLNWWGLHHDKPKVGNFMVRVKVPGGLIQPTQLRAVGRITAQFGRNYAEITTRQGLQLHWVRLGELPEVLRLIESAGLTTFGGEGDTVRNITGCPVAGIDPRELFDVRPTIEAAARFFSGTRSYSNLPRKHKYTIAACPAQCNAPEIHDVALVGMLHDGQPGFALRVGGGLANTPRFSRDLGVFVPQTEAIEVLRAVTDTWQSDLRYRVSRARARIKFMVDDYGPEAVRSMIEQRLGRSLPDAAAPRPADSADHLGVHRQRQAGRVYIGVPVPVGQITGTQLESLAGLLEGLGADLRFTRQQNIVVGNVPRGGLGELRSGLAAAGLPADSGYAYGRSVACTSHQFCNYSVAETKEKLRETVRHLARRFGEEVVADLRIHMDGCPHACAQHWIGEIGIQGTTAPAPDGPGRIEAYDLALGGGLGWRAAVGQIVLRRIPATDLERVLERLIEAWLREQAARTDGIRPRFGEFCEAAGVDRLAAIATGATLCGGMPAAEPAPQQESPLDVTIRIPGPLLGVTSGTDRVKVRAQTVGEALAAAGAQHPRFTKRVVPGGRLSKGFTVFVGEEDVRWLQGLNTSVDPGDEITILTAISGG